MVILIRKRILLSICHNPQCTGYGSVTSISKKIDYQNTCTEPNVPVYVHPWGAAEILPQYQDRLEPHKPNKTQQDTMMLVPKLIQCCVLQ